MPKEAAAGSSQGGLIYLKYTFKYRNQFDETNNDCLDAIEATSDELLGAYSRTEDDAMTATLGGRGKKRLNRVFDVIGFVYPDYCYPSRKQGKKIKAAASVISNTLKPKKVKVLTHRPKHAETAEVSKPIEGSTSAREPSRSAPVETRSELAEELGLRKSTEQPKALSLLQETELPKVSKIAAITPKRRRMASVLDAVIEFVKVSTLASAPDAEGEALKKSSEASMAKAIVEAGPTVPAEARSSEAVEEGTETRPLEAVGAPLMLVKEGVVEESESPAPRAPTEELEFIARHASGKKLSKEQIVESQHYARDLKYPRGSLVYSGDDEDDFLYCLADNKEIHVCREMADNVGYSKLKLGLSAMTKD
jgi:hypothetical protein